MLDLKCKIKDIYLYNCKRSDKSYLFIGGLTYLFEIKVVYLQIELQTNFTCLIEFAKRCVKWQDRPYNEKV